MTNTCRNIFQAIHEGKWLTIEYKNRNDQITKYWIGIKNIDVKKKTLCVDGFHVSKYTINNYIIYIDSIMSSAVVDGSYFEVNGQLIQDIRENPHCYEGVFGHSANLKILRYLEECSRMDTTPYQADYALLRYFDGDCAEDGVYCLSQEQFSILVSSFQNTETARRGRQKLRCLCMNVLSVHMPKGLYVLAYRRLYLDVKRRLLRPADCVTICREFTVNGEKQSIRQFLDADDFCLLEDFEKNQEKIKDCITRYNTHVDGVDDLPYLMAMGRDLLMDLHREYQAITDLYEREGETIAAPVRAFFGELLRRPDRRKDYPIALLNNKVNLDQLLAIHHALKYPLAYIQGPPGTGKTTTIINTILSAFFSDRTVLFASYNNHPIDSVFQTLQSIAYHHNLIPFPVVRLGNNEKVTQALDFIRETYERVKQVSIYQNTLEKNRDDEIDRTKKLTTMLKQYEESLDLKERKETIERLLKSNRQFHFQADLYGRQLQTVEQQLAELGEVSVEDALELISDNGEQFLKYLYYTSVKYIQRLGEPKNEDLMEIVSMEDPDARLEVFQKYISEEECLKKFLRIYPIVATTCISSHKLGEAKPTFDMVILDEASQCNVAISLVPIIRGRNLMLVGDPQQLNPVILLDPKDNEVLKQRYGISREYDYISNSIYKTYLACDSVSDEVLLSYHYRCDPKIIGFNNKKYYNQKLKVKSERKGREPLLYLEVPGDAAQGRNTAPAEAAQIVKFAVEHQDQSIGVITPFVYQKELIKSYLKEYGLEYVACGTVHAFQGDEKDIVLFSLALTDKTSGKTYEWLKSNKELLNVATSRAKKQLVILSNSEALTRLHGNYTDDDVFELVQYVKSNGTSKVTEKTTPSRALGIKPYSTQIEEAFLVSLNHALDFVLYQGRRCTVKKEVPISHVFSGVHAYDTYFYMGRFDFVVYDRAAQSQELPILAIELDGREHLEDEVVRERDRKKEAICKRQGFELIRVENSYARRYHYIKEVLIDYFTRAR